MIEVGTEVADAIPNGEHRILQGQGHVVLPDILAPVVREFVAER